MRYYRPSDYETVKEWWIGHGQASDRVCPSDVLPSTGFIIDDVCCVWIYMSANAKMSRVGWPVSNPKASPRKVYMGLKSVILALHEFAIEGGCPYLEATFSTPSLCKLAKSLGFHTGDTNITGFIKGP